MPKNQTNWKLWWWNRIRCLRCPPRKKRTPMDLPNLHYHPRPRPMKRICRPRHPRRRVPPQVPPPAPQMPGPLKSKSNSDYPKVRPIDSGCKAPGARDVLVGLLRVDATPKRGHRPGPGPAQLIRGIDHVTHGVCLHPLYNHPVIQMITITTNKWQKMTASMGLMRASQMVGCLLIKIRFILLYCWQRKSKKNL